MLYEYIPVVSAKSYGAADTRRVLYEFFTLFLLSHLSYFQHLSTCETLRFKADCACESYFHISWFQILIGPYVMSRAANYLLDHSFSHCQYGNSSRNRYSDMLERYCWRNGSLELPSGSMVMLYNFCLSVPSSWYIKLSWDSSLPAMLVRTAGVTRHQQFSLLWPCICFRGLLKVGCNA